MGVGTTETHPVTYRSAHLREGQIRALFALCAAATAFAACHSEVRQPSEQRRLDPRLVALGRTAPDSVVGVIVRLKAPPADSDRAALTRAGLSLGTVAGDVATGRIRVRAALALADLPSVIYVELARRIPVQPRQVGSPSLQGRIR